MQPRDIRTVATASIHHEKKLFPYRDDDYYWNLAVTTYKISYDAFEVLPDADLVLYWALSIENNPDYAEALFELAVLIEQGLTPL